MRLENKLRQILTQGSLAFGMGVLLPSKALVEIIGWAGFDFVGIDTEHSLFDMETAGELIRVADGVGLTPLVRVLKNDETLILRALDMGAKGVIVPRVSTAEDARKAVRACKYGAGGRGACPLIRANQYGLGSWAEYEESANEDTMVIALVEDLAGAENIEQIISVDGVDCVLPGPFDMSVSAGHKGNVHHAEVEKAMERLFCACKSRAVPVMYPMADVSQLPALIERGVRIFSLSCDSILFAQACQELIRSVAPFRNTKVKSVVPPALTL